MNKNNEELMRESITGEVLSTALYLIDKETDIDVDMFVYRASVIINNNLNNGFKLDTDGLKDYLKPGTLN